MSMTSKRRQERTHDGASHNSRQVPRWQTAVAALVLLAALAAAAWWAFESPETFAPVAAVGTGLWQFQRTQVAERAAAREEARREGKVAAYTELVELFVDLLSPNKKVQQKALNVDTMRDAMKKVIPWASDGVVRTWVAIRQHDTSDAHELLRLFAQMLIEIRKDLGVETTLTEIELLAIFINDLDPDFLQKGDTKAGASQP